MPQTKSSQGQVWGKFLVVRGRCGLKILDGARHDFV